MAAYLKSDGTLTENKPFSSIPGYSFGYDLGRSFRSNNFQIPRQIDIQRTLQEIQQLRPSEVPTFDSRQVKQSIMEQVPEGRPEEIQSFIPPVVQEAMERSEAQRREFEEQRLSQGQFAERYTRPAYEFVKKKLGIQDTGEFLVPKTWEEEQFPESTQAKQTRALRSLGESWIEYPIERPYEAVAMAGLGAVTPPAIAGLGTITRTLPGGTAIIPKVGTVLKWLIPSAFVGATTIETIKAPTPEEKGAVVGAALGGLTFFGAGMKAGEPIARRILIQDLFQEKLERLPPGKRAEFEEYWNQITQLSRVEPPVKNIDLSGMKRLPSNAKRPTLDFLEQFSDKQVLGGSISQRSQVYGIKRSYAESDLDLYARPGEDPKLLARVYAQMLRNAGVDRVSVVRGSKVTIQGQKVAEFHKWEGLRGNIEEVGDVWTGAEGHLTTTPSGVEILKVGTQARRKLMGAFLDLRRIAVGKGEKDIKDFKQIVQSLYKTVSIQNKKGQFNLFGPQEIVPPKVPPPGQA